MQCRHAFAEYHIAPKNKCPAVYIVAITAGVMHQSLELRTGNNNLIPSYY